MGNEIAGDLIVSEDVIADVAGHAALECYGVVGMAAPNAADGLAKILFSPGNATQTAGGRPFGNCGI